MATKKAAKKSSAKKVSTKKVSASSSSKKIPLKKICQDLKIEPRAARRKLRAASLNWHDSRERYEFTPSQASKVKEILRAEA